MGFLFLAKFSEFEINAHENPNDIHEDGKERTKKTCDPCKDDLLNRLLTIEEAISFLRF